MGNIQANYNVGDVVTMTENALENYGEQYRDVPLTVSHVATNKEQHRGFDEGAGSALYDFEELNFSLYEWEFKRG